MSNKFRKCHFACKATDCRVEHGNDIYLLDNHFLLFESVFGVLFSTIFLHESLTPRMLSGCILIFAAVVPGGEKGVE